MQNQFTAEDNARVGIVAHKITDAYLMVSMLQSYEKLRIDIDKYEDIGRLPKSVHFDGCLDRTQQNGYMSECDFELSEPLAKAILKLWREEIDAKIVELKREILKIKI